MKRNAMSSIPIFWVKPGLQFPRPDRLNFKSLLTPDKLSRQDAQWIAMIVSSYGLSLLQPAKKVATDGRSSNWVLTTNEGKKILKKYKPSVEPEQILQEHDILSQLAVFQFPAPRLNQNLHGETLTMMEDGWFALFDYLDGYFQYHEQIYFPSQTSTFIELAALSLASLHEALRDFTPVGKNPNGFISKEGTRWLSLSWYLEQLAADKQQTQDRLKGNLDDELNVIYSREAWIEDRLTMLDEMLATAPLDRVVIHGDYGPYNLLFKHGKPVVMIDFELARLDWRLTDLATSMNTFTRNRLGFQQNKMRRFIQAYQRASNVGTEQLDYLPVVWEYLSLRRLIVCWSRVLETGQKKWLAESLDRMQIIDWITTHKSDIMKLVNR
ncbi:MAG TPA: phosphotransferase [Anaerolineales bacterium]|nr:phosphotransferase [Anaerolineales bacterium]